jgi:hypothetical protein
MLINAFLFVYLTISVQGLEFKFARRLNVDNVNLYIADSHLSMYGINDCIDACKRRKNCRFINYEPRTKLCQMINTIKEETFTTADHLETVPGFYFGDKTWWNMVNIIPKVLTQSKRFLCLVYKNIPDLFNWFELS